MRLAVAVVGPFKSIAYPQTVAIDPGVTVMVGMNEAGKTAFLQGLNKCRDVLGYARFKPLDDYPRRELPSYLRTHDATPATAARLVYELSAGDADDINRTFHTQLPAGFRFSLEYKYDNSITVDLPIDERPVVVQLLKEADLSDEVRAAVNQALSLRALRDSLRSTKLSYTDNEFMSALDARIEKVASGSVVAAELWAWLEPRVPKFLYFGDYEVLPSKMNLKDLAARRAQAVTDTSALTPEHRGVLALLRMADIEVADFAQPGSYEELKAKIEGVSIALTDQIMEFWKQNEDLEVQIDIAADPYDEPPFNDGPNLYLRIRNRRHRGVSTPFKQRSRGFIWFFSFLVWFDSVQQQLAQQASQDIVLLLDEPGLSLHALAQQDLLKYIDVLAKKHQVIYTTHSPFLLDSSRLHQVRTVEDQPKRGSTISSDTAGADPRTVYPLRAALAWSLADRLLSAPANLLVEDTADLLYLSLLSSQLNGAGRGLRPDLALVPIGGLNAVAGFAALAGSAGGRMALLVSGDAGTGDAALQALGASPRHVTVRTFRAPGGGADGDVEDLLDPAFYVRLVCAAYADALGARTLHPDDLPAGNRIVDRVERWMAAQGLGTRIDRYRVASQMALRPDLDPGDDARTRFGALFAAVNRLF